MGLTLSSRPCSQVSGPSVRGAWTHSSAMSRPDVCGSEESGNSGWRDVMGGDLTAKYERDWCKMRDQAADTALSMRTARERLAGLQRRVVSAHAGFRALSQALCNIDPMQSALDVLSRQVTQICHKVDRVEIALARAQKLRVERIVKQWNAEKDAVVAAHARRSRKALAEKLKMRRGARERVLESQFRDAVRRFETTGRAPEGFVYEVSVQGSWVPCRIEREYTAAVGAANNSLCDVVISGGNILVGISAQLVRKASGARHSVARHSVQEEGDAKSETAEQDCTSLDAPLLLSTPEKLNSFYDDVSDSSEGEPPARCPSGHAMQRSLATAPGPICDRCLKPVLVGGAVLTCQVCDYEVCAICFQRTGSGDKVKEKNDDDNDDDDDDDEDDDDDDDDDDDQNTDKNELNGSTCAGKGLPETKDENASTVKRRSETLAGYLEHRSSELEYDSDSELP